MQDLRALGAVVWDLADLGGEVLDLLVFWRGEVIPVEVKRPGCEQDLTNGEREGIAKLRRAGVEPVIATTAEDVLERWMA